MKHKFSLLILVFILLALLYTRFVNLGWGLPYPFHPDERNMSVALEQLRCPLPFKQDCLHPHFFAYGQFPLYVGYFLLHMYYILSGQLGKIITFLDATIVLRFIAAVSSIITVLFILKIIQIFLEHMYPKMRSPILTYAATLPFIFSPGLIQTAHFGTTESILICIYTSLFYLGLLRLDERMSKKKYLLLSALLCAVAAATKISSMLFLFVPFYVGFMREIKMSLREEKSNFFSKILQIFFDFLVFFIFVIILSLLFSPYNLIALGDFLSSMQYESAVALGSMKVFYTHQYVLTIPVIFQFIKIFPYALGVPVILYFILGFITLPYDKRFNLLRMSFLVYFLPTAFMYAKWTRFMSPIFPHFILIAVLFLINLYTIVSFYARQTKNKNQWLFVISNFLFFLLITTFCIRGIAFLSIYTNRDVRYEASDWIYNNIPNNSYVLSETANVVDIPIQDPTVKEIPPLKNLQYISFNFYDLDVNTQLQQELQSHINDSAYVFIPSRRVFMNYTCYINPDIYGTVTKINSSFLTGVAKNKCTYLSNTYPQLNKYYTDLFRGKLGFKEVAQFSSYPKISILGRTILQYPDEEAEETWTVFDHPVIRIYRKIEDRN